MGLWEGPIHRIYHGKEYVPAAIIAAMSFSVDLYR